MNPSERTSTLTVERPAPERMARVLDTVLVSPDTFPSVLFMGASARREYTRERLPDAQKPQKTTREGVPLWSGKFATVNWRGNAEMLTVTLPMADNPLEVLTPGTPVRLVNLVFGVSPKRDGEGFTTWCSADGLELAEPGAGAAAA